MESQALKKHLEIINKLTGSKHTTGVFPANKLPSKVKKPLAFILHSEDADQYLGHWSAVYAAKSNKKPVQYFCSYGLEPTNKHHIRFLKRYGKKFVFNKRCLQEIDSVVCGGYVLLYLAYKMLYIPKIETFLKKFKSAECNTNDKIIAAATNFLVEKLESEGQKMLK